MTQHLCSSDRTQQILDAARVCFTSLGYASTKVTDIAKEAGLSKGGVYFHFSSKRQIFRSLVEAEYDLAMGYLDEITISDQPLLDKFRLLGEHFVALFSNRDQSRFMITIGEMALRDEDVARMLHDLQGHYFERISQLLESAHLQNEINPVDTHTTAIVLKALIDGIQLNFALGLEVDHDLLIETILIILTQGLSPAPELP